MTKRTLCPRYRPHLARPAGSLGWVTVTSYVLLRGRSLTPRWVAWYPKTAPTFTDAVALVQTTLDRRSPLILVPVSP